MQNKHVQFSTKLKKMKQPNTSPTPQRDKYNLSEST